jgi:CRP-like cAMP-binding protein
MALDIVVKSLLRVELIAGLKPLQVAELARRSDRIVYRPGDTIICEGATGDAAVLIVKGDAVRTSGPGLADGAEPIADGSLLGEICMLVEAQHTSTVVARGVTRAIRITRDAVLEQIAADPGIADQLSHTLSRRLHGIATQLRDIDAALANSEATYLPVSAAYDAGHAGFAVH